MREQAERIARCRLSFQIRGANGKSGLVQQQVVDTAMFADAEDSSSGGFVETVQLSQTFFDQLRRHPVPVEDSPFAPSAGTRSRWISIAGSPIACTC